MNRSTILKGIVIPYNWDENGNIVSIAVSTAGELEYPIEMNGMGKSLLRQINHLVRLEGIVGVIKDQKNNAMIKVNTFEILNWEQ